MNLDTIFQEALLEATRIQCSTEPLSIKTERLDASISKTVLELENIEQKAKMIRFQLIALKEYLLSEKKD